MSKSFEVAAGSVSDRLTRAQGRYAPLNRRRHELRDEIAGLTDLLTIVERDLEAARIELVAAHAAYHAEFGHSGGRP